MEDITPSVLIKESLGKADPCVGTAVGVGVGFPKEKRRDAGSKVQFRCLSLVPAMKKVDTACTHGGLLYPNGLLYPYGLLTPKLCYTTKLCCTPRLSQTPRLSRTPRPSRTSATASGAHVCHIYPLVGGWVVLLHGAQALPGSPIVTPDSIQLPWNRQSD